MAIKFIHSKEMLESLILVNNLKITKRHKKWNIACRDEVIKIVMVINCKTITFS